MDKREDIVKAIELVENNFYNRTKKILHVGYHIHDSHGAMYHITIDTDEYWEILDMKEIIIFMGIKGFVGISAYHADMLEITIC